MPRYAISDIHGCSKTFATLLARLKLQKSDELYLLGDYVDRGPDSVGVIGQIMDLQQRGYNVQCLKGNHEEMTIDAYQRQAYHRHGYSDQHIRWMMNLADYLEIPGYILVHAGLNFAVENPLEDTKEMRWIRYWIEDIDRLWLGDRVIVHGHTPQSYLETRRDVNNVDTVPAICIDAGCAFQARNLGYLVALDLDTLEVHSLRRIDLV
ncbi:serine/threonine protein phosphatase [Lewinellaceae bacterium SD302]|nr:serine/threonine protein phosphatase [Lewinellaceae bacterium SD302]